VDCGNDAALDLSSELTLEAWLRPEESSRKRGWEDWSHRKLITIDHSNVKEDLEDFPLLFSVTDEELREVAHGGVLQYDAGDVVFTLEDGHMLDHEIEFYDGDTGRIEIWIRVPDLWADEDTNILMYFGNPDINDQDDPDEVWDNDYVTVHHLEETANPIRDSTDQDHDASSATGNGLNAVGKVDGGHAFDGSNDYSTLGNHSDFVFDGDFTLSGWVKREDNGQQWSHIICKDEAYHLRINGDTLVFHIEAIGDLPALTPLPNNEWCHLAAVFIDGSPNDLELYIDGRRDVSGNFWGSPNGSDLSLDLGCKGGVEDFFEGVLDEIRISETSRSAAWINASYLNQEDPSSFFRYGYAEPLAVRKTGCYGIGANRSTAIASLNGRTLSASLEDGWNHIAETYDGTNLRLYVNGVLRSTADLSEPITTSSRDLFIGQTYVGRVDEVRLYNRALTPPEIEQHYHIYTGNGSLRSTEIELPPGMVWDSLHFNCSHPPGTRLNISVWDAGTDELLTWVASPVFTTTADLLYVDPLGSPSLYLSGEFSSLPTRASTLFNWTVTWKPATAPSITEEPGRIIAYEETPEENILDLAPYFSDPYSRFREPSYSLFHQSDTDHIVLELNGSILSVKWLEDNWTGVVTLSVSCTNAFNLTSVSPDFDVVVLGVNDPPLVKLFSPGNGTTVGEKDVTLHWKGYDIDNSTSDIRYDLYFGESNPPPLLAGGLTSHEWHLRDLAENTTYYWYAVPTDGMGQGRSISGIWEFTVDTSIPSPAARLLSPVNGAILNDTITTLRWEAEDPSGGELEFHIYIGTDEDSLSRVSITNETEFILSGLLDNSTYHWKVVPVSGTLQGSCTCGLWSFRIMLGREFSEPVEDMFWMIIAPEGITMEPGSNATINVTFHNNGSSPVTVDLNITGPLAESMDMEYVLNAVSGNTTIGITVSLSADSMEGRYLHTLWALVGGMQLKQDFYVEVKAYGSDDGGPSPNGTGRDYAALFWKWAPYALGIILLIIVIMVIVALSRKRKSRENEVSPPGNTGYTIRPVPGDQPAEMRPASAAVEGQVGKNGRVKADVRGAPRAPVEGRKGDSGGGPVGERTSPATKGDGGGDGAPGKGYGGPSRKGHDSEKKVVKRVRKDGMRGAGGPVSEAHGSEAQEVGKSVGPGDLAHEKRDHATGREDGKATAKKSEYAVVGKGMGTEFGEGGSMDGENDDNEGGDWETDEEDGERYETEGSGDWKNDEDGDWEEDEEDEDGHWVSEDDNDWNDDEVDNERESEGDGDNEWDEDESDADEDWLSDEDGDGMKDEEDEDGDWLGDEDGSRKEGDVGEGDDRMEDDWEEEYEQDDEDSWDRPYRIVEDDDSESEDEEYETWSSALEVDHYRPHSGDATGEEAEEVTGVGEADGWLDDDVKDGSSAEGKGLSGRGPEADVTDKVLKDERAGKEGTAGEAEKAEVEDERVKENDVSPVGDSDRGTLAKIPVKRIAVEKETGEKVVLCEDCNKYYKPSEGSCPNCSKTEGDGRSPLGLDPTDKEADEDDDGPARRYPEEELYDDDLELEDIIEGM